MKLCLIAAMDRNRVIGTENRLPWRLSEDLKRFKEITMGAPVIMGRKTFESIGRALPGRLNIVVTRNSNFVVPDGVRVVGSINQALLLVEETNHRCPRGEIFVIGGGQIYLETIKLADRLYLTRVDTEVKGDAWFPEFSGFEITSRESLQGEPSFEFQVWDRVG